MTSYVFAKYHSYLYHISQIVDSKYDLLLSKCVEFVTKLQSNEDFKIRHYPRRNYPVTHHKASVGGDTVGDGLDPAVREEDAVLTLDGAPVTRLLLVEVIPDVVLDSIAVPAQGKILITCKSGYQTLG